MKQEEYLAGIKKQQSLIRKLFAYRKRRIFVTHMVNEKGIGVLAENYNQVTFTNSFRDWKTALGKLLANVLQIDVDKEWRFM